GGVFEGRAGASGGRPPTSGGSPASSGGSEARRALGPILRFAEPADEGRQSRVPEELPHRLRLAEVKPVVVGRAMELRTRRLARRLARPPARQLGAVEPVEAAVGGPRDGAPPGPRFVEGRHREGLAVAELLDLGDFGRALRALDPVELLLPGDVANHPRDRIDRLEAP